MNAPERPMGEGGSPTEARTRADTPRMLDVEFYIEAAQQHGADSEPDHEVGDLQDFLRAMWAMLSVEQRRQFARSASVADVLDGAGADYAADLAALQGCEPGADRLATPATPLADASLVDVALYLYP